MVLSSKISIQEKVDLTKNLSVMLKSGISILDALEALHKQTTSKKYADLIARIILSIENGNLLSETFRREEKVLGAIFIHLIYAGEQSGTLQENLSFLSEWFERSGDLERDVKSATLYPRLVFGAALLLGGALALFILPKLIPLFSQLDVELPKMTQFLLDLTLFLEIYWLETIIGLILATIGLISLNKISIVKQFFHLLYLKTPFIGNIIKDYHLALSTQLFMILLKSGISINESIKIVGGTMSNVHYSNSLYKMQSRIETGVALSEAMESYKSLYPPTFITIVSVGEKSGTINESFKYLSDHYTKEVNALTKKLPAIIEPILLIFIALIVGFVALSIIMPIYQLTGSITR